MNTKQLLERLRLTAAVRRDFYGSLAAVLAQGLPVTDVLQKMRVQFAKTRHPMAGVVAKIVRRMRGAEGGSAVVSLGAALEGLFPAQEVSLIASGEMAGNTAQGFSAAQRYLDNITQMAAAIRSQLIKPTFYTIIFLGLMAFLAIKIMPTFAKFRPVQSWPPIAQNLYEFASLYWFYPIGCVATLIAFWGFLRFCDHWTGDTRDWCDRHLPLFGMIAEKQGAMFLTSLASFLSAGIPVFDALKKIAANSTPYMRWQCQQVENHLRHGDRLEDALLRLSIIPPTHHWLISVYGMLANPAKAYYLISDEIMRRFVLRIKVILGEVLSGIMLVLVGGGIIWTWFSLMEIAMPR